jgi:phage shock protein PspC (stress-responsive transcriptional regulator)
MNENQHDGPASEPGMGTPPGEHARPDDTERIQAPPTDGGATSPPPPYDAPYGAGHGQSWAPPGANAGDRVLEGVRALRRSRDDRVVAGVCGGVARQLGIDPLLVRVVTAVLAIFGAGVVLYAAAWLLLPLDDGTPSIGQQAVSPNRTQSSTRTVLLAVVLAIVATLGLGAAFSHWDGSFLLALTIGGLVAWLLLRDRRGESQPTTPGYRQPPTPPAAAYGPPAAAYAPPAGATGPVTLTKEQPGGATAGATPAAAPGGSSPTDPLPGYPPASPPPSGPPAGPYGYRPPVPPPPPPAPRRPHSALFSVTMSLVLVGLGTLKLIELAGTDVVPSAYPALALAIIGLALLVGTRVGRSRGLIAMGIIAMLLTGAVSAADTWDDHDHNRVDLRLTPSTLSELPASQDFGAGTVRYDLTRLDFTGATQSLRLSIGAGEIVVIVPRDVDVTATASMGVGQVDLFGQGRGGLPSDLTVTDLGGDGAGGGTLDLALDAGVGHLEVRRG